ncbi:MAG: peptidoglycan DD-metalloendopeptidase family protein [Saprospiraceae bacterium]
MELPSIRNTFRRLTKKQLFRGYIFSLVGLTLAAGFYFGVPKLLTSEHTPVVKTLAELHALPITVPNERYGFALDTFQVFENQIRNGTFLGDILLKYNLDYPSIEKLVQNAKGVFDVRRFQAGKPYTVLTKDSTQRAEYFIYEPNAYEYIVFHLQDLKVEKIERQIDTEVHTATGRIPEGGSLWKTMSDQGLSAMLADRMEDALQWSLDFTRLQAGDEFKLVYEQNFIEGEEVGVGKVKAAYYKTGENEYYAIYYSDGEDNTGYYDLKGQPMKGSFLKAPVRASRISSYYNLNRLHPILKYRRPHLGTDYAAPYGTEIMAVGNGVVEQASYTKGNGNFVKIRHDKTYETQYLHMQSFAKGIRPGVHVQQGQVIGYVGSTGLATGPHVCFRFWKNGQQVNHLRLTFPPADPLPDNLMPSFNELKDGYLLMMENIEPVEVTAEDSTAEAPEEVVGQP